MFVCAKFSALENVRKICEQIHLFPPSHDTLTHEAGESF